MKRRGQKSWWGRVYKIYGIASIVLQALVIGYIVLLAYPQALFAHAVEHGEFRVYSREPMGAEIAHVLDAAEARLKASPIYDAKVRRDIYLTNGFGIYALLSHKAYNSFANSVPFIDNVFINKTDVPADRVFINRGYSNSRSLSGVIAHETVHLFIRKRYGTLSAMRIPTWKVEGYCEYIAGDSTITLDEGIGRWREVPSDDTRYRYIKYHLMVRHLLEYDKITVDELFTASFDETEVADRTFAALRE